MIKHWDTRNTTYCIKKSQKLPNIVILERIRITLCIFRNFCSRKVLTSHIRDGIESNLSLRYPAEFKSDFNPLDLLNNPISDACQ